MSTNYIDKTKIKGKTYDVHDIRMPVATNVDIGKFVSVDNNGNFTYTGSSSSDIQIHTTSYWNQQTSYIPPAGTLIIYSDYSILDNKDVPNFKVGDGLAYVVDLPFIEDDLRAQLTEHINNSSIHVTAQEKQNWNNKVFVNVEQISQTDQEYKLTFTTS